jgi:hypothetical protein
MLEDGRTPRLHGARQRAGLRAERLSEHLTTA